MKVKHNMGHGQTGFHPPATLDNDMLQSAGTVYNAGDHAECSHDQAGAAHTRSHAHTHLEFSNTQYL